MSETRVKILARDLGKGAVVVFVSFYFVFALSHFRRPDHQSDPGTGKVFFYKPEGNVV